MTDQGKELHVGDKVEEVHGPFVSTWEVVEIIEPGAVLAYVGDVRFVGFGNTQVAPNGGQLTSTPEQSFIGRAHWHSTKRVVSSEGSNALE